MRRLHALPGMPGWIRHVTGYPLPAGLQPYQPVHVIENPPGTHFADLTVRDAHGRHHTLYFLHIDVGFELRLEPPNDDGHYHHESDPRVILQLYRDLHHAWADIPESNNRPAYIQEITTRYRHYLTRNGYNPDHLPTGLEQRALAAATKAPPPPLNQRSRLRQQYLGDT